MCFLLFLWIVMFIAAVADRGQCCGCCHSEKPAPISSISVSMAKILCAIGTMLASLALTDALIGPDPIPWPGPPGAVNSFVFPYHPWLFGVAALVAYGIAADLVLREEG